MSHKSRQRSLILILLLGLFVGVMAVTAATLPSAPQSLIVVNTTDDELNDDGDCALREAIQAANTNTAVDACPAGGVISTTISLPAGTYTLAIPGVGEDANATGDLDILADVAIVGAGADETIIHAGGLDRALDIVAGVTAEISGLTVTGGSATYGGGIFNMGTLDLRDCRISHNATTFSGGGIASNLGHLHVTNCEISQNNAADGGGGLYLWDNVTTISHATIQENAALSVDYGDGGGIRNLAYTVNATLAISDSRVISNTAHNGGGGIANSVNTGRTATLTLDRVIVSGNAAVVGGDYLRGLGGGIHNAVLVGASSGAGIVTVRDSAISGNTATNGGGIGSTPTSATGFVTMQVTVENSVVSHNTAGGSGMMVGNGGGILNLDGSLTVINSTLSGNQATGSGSTFSGLGGGVLAGSQSLPATTTLVATTISENTAALAGGGLTNANLGGSTTVAFKNSLLAANGALNCFNSSGIVNSLGYNLDSQNTCGFNQASDLINSDPLLGPFSGAGETFIYPLLADSPAIDAGACTDHADNPLLADQRGVARPQGDGCDIGAYEAAAALSLTKDVAVEGSVTAVTPGALVTYTLTLSNSGVVTAATALLTDSLPLEMNFVEWVTQPDGADVDEDEITWSGDVAVGESVVVAFTAVHVGAAGETVTNTAQFSHSSGSGAASVSFTVAPRFYLYLPLVTSE